MSCSEECSVGCSGIIGLVVNRLKVGRAFEFELFGFRVELFVLLISRLSVVSISDKGLSVIDLIPLVFIAIMIRDYNFRSGVFMIRGAENCCCDVSFMIK